MKVPEARRNHHATVVVLGSHGVFIEGASGTGKTQLALRLLRFANAGGRLARLVADDQVFLAARHGRLVATCPPSIKGLVEARGFGPAPITAEPGAVIDLVVRLAEPPVPRLDEGRMRELCGLALPMLTLAARDPAAANAILARLGVDPFCDGSG